jgi:hypothetical protein
VSDMWEEPTKPARTPKQEKKKKNRSRGPSRAPPTAPALKETNQTRMIRASAVLRPEYWINQQRGCLQNYASIPYMRDSCYHSFHRFLKVCVPFYFKDLMVDWVQIEKLLQYRRLLKQGTCRLEYGPFRKLCLHSSWWSQASGVLLFFPCQASTSNLRLFQF